MNEKLKDHLSFPEDEDILLMGTREIENKVKEATSYIEADIAALATEHTSLVDEITQMNQYATHNRNSQGNFRLLRITS